MMLKKTVPLMLMAVALTACGTPGKSDVQGAVDRLAKDMSTPWGSDKPIVKDTKCTKAGNDTFSCVTSIATSSYPKPMTVTLQLTKLNGQWQAQVTNMGL
jgi:hypothetical protein